MKIYAIVAKTWVPMEHNDIIKLTTTTEKANEYISGLPSWSGGEYIVEEIEVED